MQNVILYNNIYILIFTRFVLSGHLIVMSELIMEHTCAVIFLIYLCHFIQIQTIIFRLLYLDCFLTKHFFMSFGWFIINESSVRSSVYFFRYFWLFNFINVAFNFCKYGKKRYNTSRYILYFLLQFEVITFSKAKKNIE